MTLAAHYAPHIALCALLGLAAALCLTQHHPHPDRPACGRTAKEQHMSVANLSNPLEGPTADHPADGPELKRCAACGRVGVRQFVTVPATEFNEATVVCQAKAACLTRWENAA